MSASMLDYYDAQMFDYSGDADVHMHTTFPSPKAWLQTEAPMDDDIEPLSTEPIHSLLQDVEVDMEPAYTDGVEYDMLDDVSGDGGGTESVDVDFVDAEHDGEPQHEPSSDFQQGSIPLEPLSETHAAPEPLAQHTESLHSPLAGSSIGGEIPQPILEELSRFTSVPDDVDSDGVPDEAPSHADTVDGAYIDQLDEVRPEPFDGPSEGAQAGVDPSEGEGEPSVAHEDHTVPDLVPDHDSFPGASSDVPFIEPEHPLADNGPSVPDEEVSGHSIEGSGDRSRLEHEPYFDENREDGDDPHEITDGIYIDPPPPVLIDLPNLSSSEKAEYCLFSHPFDGTSGSPREMASTSAISHFSLLLHHQPALYYECLPEVFDALRQEEQTQHLIDFAEGELVIDAYDLQLEISEDDIHAREVTLHDLNNLHDGLGLSGPLRLRLRCRTPRFIVKYNLLREQVFPSSSTDEDAEVYEESQEVVYHKDENYSEQEGDGEQFYEPQAGDSFEDGEDERTSNDAPGDQDQGQGTDSCSEPHPDDHTSLEEAAHLSNHDDDYHQDPEGTTSVDDLDSATVHAQADADGSDELFEEATEHATFSESYEEDEVTGDIVEEEVVADHDQPVDVQDALAPLEDVVPEGGMDGHADPNVGDGVRPSEGDDAGPGVEDDAGYDDDDDLDAPTGIVHEDGEGLSDDVLPYSVPVGEEGDQTLANVGDSSMPSDYGNAQFETDLSTAPTDSSIQTQTDAMWDTLENTDLDESFDENDLEEDKGVDQDDDFSDSTLSSSTQYKAYGGEDALVRPQSSSSKRHFDEVDAENDVGLVTGSDSRAASPNSKRARVN